jgi:S-adenosylmethionine synthetase
MYYFFSSESVTEGHPDKLSDLISDAILDAFLAQDSKSRVACETAVTTNYVLVFGEITSRANVDIESVVRRVIKEVGYTDEAIGFDYRQVEVNVKIKPQSDDIALGVNMSLEKDLGAGDQGLMFGYANQDTKTLMPLPIFLAHALAKRLSEVRKQGKIKGLRPDGKTQVTVAYEGSRPVYVDQVVLSTQHDAEVSLDQLKPLIMKHVIEPVLGHYINEKTQYKINPTGRFVTGGPNGDAGLTGRKIIVDTYGGFARHGGGAFSGKDATKVDRSASYMARYIAKNVVAADLADACEIQIAYAIGVAHPVSVYVNTYQTEKVSFEKLEKAVLQAFDLRPRAIIQKLELNRPIYYQTASYGHFGREDIDVPWEKTDMVERLKELVYN